MKLRDWWSNLVAVRGGGRVNVRLVNWNGSTVEQRKPQGVSRFGSVPLAVPRLPAAAGDGCAAVFDIMFPGTEYVKMAIYLLRN